MSKKSLIEVVIPVYNEEEELEKNTLKLYHFLKENLTDFNWQITIADNASTDQTANISKKLSRQFKEIGFIHLSQKGRGRAIKKAWQASKADILFYMDIDLSTDLKHFPFLIKSLISDFDIAIGSRLLPESKVYHRTLKREIISHCYNILIKIFFNISFSDAQCGFKAVTKKTVRNLLPIIKDNEWFMDSELLIIGEKSGYKIYEEPVTWRDNPGSTVRVLPTIMGDLKGLWRLFRTQPWKKKMILSKTPPLSF